MFKIEIWIYKFDVDNLFKCKEYVEYIKVDLYFFYFDDV